MTDAADRYTHNGALETLPSGRDDEIGTLARAFEKMVEDLKNRESLIVAANKRLNQTNQDLRHFSHIASHDLREPARRIVGLADLVLEDERGRISATGQDILNRLQQESLRMLDQISDFRVMTSIGVGTLLRAEVDLGVLVRSVLTEFDAVLMDRGVDVTIEELPSVRAYENLVFVLYRNLIENALKHTDRPAFSLTFTAEQADGRWVLGVRNTGSSIDEEKQELVFSPFTRLDSGVPGTGMGLSISRRIVECHEGAIWVESGSDYVHIKFDLEKNASDDS
jgi:signal transduction histidine kinase